MTERKMLEHKKYYIIIIVAFTLLIGYLHYKTDPENYVLHDIQTELHYIPLLLAALVFGLKGALLTFAAITVLYMPYFLAAWSDPMFSMYRLFQILLSGCSAFAVAFLAGFLVDRERRHREQAERNRYLASVGRVATTIVHDLKNPLITIIGFTRRLQKGKGDPDGALRSIMESALSMQRIVHDVLDFTRPINLTFSEEDIRNVVNRACDSCRTSAKKQQVTLSVHLPPEPVKARIGKAHMERAIVNIISNAIDASGRDEEVTVNAGRGENGPVIRIRDNGPGMDSETLENIFVPFFTRKHVGTGLGMSIAKKIIDGHHGKIRIKSKPGVGTEMIIELPDNLNAGRDNGKPAG